jgi:hypothetical protein
MRERRALINAASLKSLILQNRFRRSGESFIYSWLRYMCNDVPLSAYRRVPSGLNGA